MAGGKGEPYRPPCGGWRNRPLWLGPCTNHFRKSEAAVVSRLNIVNGGSGYTWAHIQIAPPNPSNPDYGQAATARATIKDGAIVRVEIINHGWGYSSPPEVTVTGDGSGAEITAELAGPKLLLNVACLQGCPPNGPGTLPSPEDCQSPLIYHDHNCYTETDIWIDLSECRKVGWKSLAIEKTWHGMIGFLHSLDPEEPITKKYLGITRRVRHEMVQEQWQSFALAFRWTAGANCSIGSQVNITSGARSVTSYQWDAHAEFWMDGWEEPEPRESAAGIFAQAAFFASYQDAIEKWGSLRPSRGLISLPDNWHAVPRFTGTPEDVEEFILQLGFDSASVTLSDDRLLITMSLAHDTGFDQDGNRFVHTESAEVEVLLGIPTTPEDVVAFLRPEQTGWDIGDDIQMPWREDNNCHIVPLIRWNEPVMYVEPDVGLPSEPPDLTSEPSGQRIGEPVPTVRIEDGQRWVPYVHWDVRNADWVPLSSGLPPATTHWKEWQMSVQEPPGAGAGWMYWRCADHRFILGIYAEVFSWVKSHNFARPCGPDRFRIDTRDASYQEAYGMSYCDAMDAGRPQLYLFRDSQNNPIAPPICGRIRVSRVEPVDNTTCKLVLAAHDPAHSLQAGDTISISGIPGLNGTKTVSAMDGMNPVVPGTAPQEYDGNGYISSPGAPHWKWNDDQAKGEYVVKHYIWTRDEQMQLVSVDCETRCVERTPCCPGYILASPLGYSEPWPRCALAVESVAFPSLLLYGRDTAAAVYIRLRRRDPLWVPDPGDIECINGIQFYLGDPPPQVEARCSIPEGAPALPLGFVYGGEDDPELQFDGVACPHNGVLI